MAKNYWLLKSEPNVFSIDDLQNAKNQTTHWDGVRNYQARNYLRDSIKIGDEVFFYHSNSEPSGIAGIAIVVKEGYPDFTALDPESDHFDPKSTKENPIWFMVDIKFKAKFKELLGLPYLKTIDDLSGMVLLNKGSRLSVQPVTPEHWQKIMKLAKF